MRFSNIARSKGVRLLPAVAILSATLLAGCGSGGPGSGAGSITVSGAWARPSQAMAGAGAGYLVIKNTGASEDAITGGTSVVAKAVEVHETVDMSSALPSASADGMGSGMASPAASSGMGSGMGSGGSMMGMQKIDRLVIPAGGSVELKPGSYHLMLIDLTQELKAGTTIEITLNFEKAGPMKVTFEVRAS